MHKQGSSVSDFANYVPVGNAVEKLKKWQSQGVEILYLSSHENKEDIEKDKLVLTKYGFQNVKFIGEIMEKVMQILQNKLCPIF